MGWGGRGGRGHGRRDGLFWGARLRWLGGLVYNQGTFLRRGRGCSLLYLLWGMLVVGDGCVSKGVV